MRRVRLVRARRLGVARVCLQHLARLGAQRTEQLQRRRRTEQIAILAVDQCCRRIHTRVDDQLAQRAQLEHADGLPVHVQRQRKQKRQCRAQTPRRRLIGHRAEVQLGLQGIAAAAPFARALKAARTAARTRHSTQVQAPKARVHRVQHAAQIAPVRRRCQHKVRPLGAVLPQPLEQHVEHAHAVLQEHNCRRRSDPRRKPSNRTVRCVRLGRHNEAIDRVVGRRSSLRVQR